MALLLERLEREFRTKPQQLEIQYSGEARIQWTSCRQPRVSCSQSSVRGFSWMAGTAVAKRFGIPSLVIGATVVAFGTSMPEFTVNLHSAVSGSTDLALGNILGSNLFNIAFIIGVVALITPLESSASIWASMLAASTPMPLPISPKSMFFFTRVR